MQNSKLRHHGECAFSLLRNDAYKTIYLKGWNDNIQKTKKVAVFKTKIVTEFGLFKMTWFWILYMYTVEAQW